jgi:hypothetical protein
MTFTMPTLLSIETALLARYGEVLSDGTLSMVGAGINTLLRPPGTDIGLMLVATLLVEGPSVGPFPVRLMLRDGDGNMVLEGELAVTSEGDGLRRVPVVVPVVFPAAAASGEWTMSLVTEDDVRLLTVSVGAAPVNTQN